MNQEKQHCTPKPEKMPVDTGKWGDELHLSNFINSYYQYRDTQKLNNIKKILIVGPGQGLDCAVFKWKNYDVTTFDIDETFKPDYCGSVHDLGAFENNKFDLVTASHVLEHLAEPYLDISLKEIARVGRYALIYLPVAGRHFQCRLKLDLKGIDTSIIFDAFNYFHKPSGVMPAYCQKQHFWEVGMRGFRVKDLVNRFNHCFKILHHYRNKDWLPSYNFVLESKLND